jgi:hypothetical protein
VTALCLCFLQFVPQDMNGLADPYLIVKVGSGGKGEGKYINDRTNKIKETLNPGTYRVYGGSGEKSVEVQYSIAVQYIAAQYSVRGSAAGKGGKD